MVQAQHHVLRGHDGGLAEAGNSTLLDAKHQRARFQLPRRDSGTCTAIWSPSKSALKAAQTSGCSWMALLDQDGLKAWMPRRCSVGAMVEHDRVP